jgi:hypothetical protein
MWPPTPIKTACLIKTGAQKEDLAARNFAALANKIVFISVSDTAGCAKNELFLLIHPIQQKKNVSRMN